MGGTQGNMLDNAQVKRPVTLRDPQMCSKATSWECSQSQREPCTEGSFPMTATCWPFLPRVLLKDNRCLYFSTTL